MAVEIERKFLVKDASWRAAVRESRPMRQGYLGGTRCSVRVRVAGEQAFLNIKSLELGARRLEYEVRVPVDDGQELLTHLADGPLVEKVRHHVPVGDHLWEVDEFSGDNAGLVVAEIELADEEEAFERPPWIGDEVTDDRRYYNVYLARHPYATWNES